MWLWMIVACLSENAAQEQWNDALEDYRACEAGDTCVLVYPGCPLGCWAVVNESEEDAATRRASSLRAQTQECAYDCIDGPTNLRCDAGRCVGDTGVAAIGR